MMRTSQDVHQLSSGTKCACGNTPTTAPAIHGDLRRRRLRIFAPARAPGIFCLTLRTDPMKSKTYITALAALAAILIFAGCAGHDYREDRRDTRQDTRQDVRHERQDARW